MKRKFLSLLLTLVVFTSTMFSVNAIPNTVTFNSRKLSGVNIQDGAIANYKTVTSGNATIIGFCLNQSLKSPDKGATISYKETITDPGYIYVFENGYTGTWNTDLLGSGLTNDQKYYATQLAVWLYQGKISASSLNNSHPEVKAAIKLYENAKKAKTVKNSIDIKASKTDMTIDEKYYKSDNMTVSGTGYTKFKVTLVNATGYAEIVTTKGKVYKSGDTLDAGTSFYVRIPKDKIYNDMQITVQVNATAKVNKVYRYTTNNSSYQDIGIMLSESQSLKDSIKINLDKEELFKVSIIKKDSATDKPLAGATLVLKDSNGNVIDTWVSTTEAHTIENLKPGVYSVTETKAPAGYILNSTPVKFTFVSGGDTSKTVTFYNTKEETFKVSIIKKDSATDKPLAGATLVLKDSNGNVIDTWVSTTEAHTIENLKPGTYTVTETKAPSGYVLNDKPIEFTISAGGESEKTITFYNTKEEVKTGTIKISKQDITTKKELPGATLTIKDANGNIIATWVSTNEPHYITNLAPGKYILIETTSPEGYGLSDEIIEFEIDENGNPSSELIVMYNSPIPVTADINLTLLVLGFIGTISMGIFSIYKFAKQQ